jgi:hypothetical protein
MNFWEPCTPAQLGHPNIQQQDMRVKCFHATQHLAAIRGVADDLNGLLLCQDPARPFPEEGMSVSDEYRDQVHSGKIPLSSARDEQPRSACRDHSFWMLTSEIEPALGRS